MYTHTEILGNLKRIQKEVDRKGEGEMRESLMEDLASLAIKCIGNENVTPKQQKALIEQLKSLEWGIKSMPENNIDY